jgi:hypothetical protein
MRKILLITIVTFLISCAGKDEKAKANLDRNLFTFFKEGFRKADSTLHLDSVRVIKFDTVTKQSLLYSKIMSLYDEIDSHKGSYNNAMREYHSDIQIAKLYASLDKTLFDHYVDEARQKLAEVKELNRTDSLIQKTADSLTKIHKTADTTKLLYYQLKCLVQYQRKDMTVSRDTLFAFLSPEKDLVKREEMKW